MSNVDDKVVPFVLEGDPAQPNAGLRPLLQAKMFGLPKARVEFYELDRSEMPAGIYFDCTVIGMDEDDGGVHVSIEYKKKVEFIKPPLMEYVHADEIPEVYRKVAENMERTFTYLTALAYGLSPLDAVDLAILWHGTGLPDGFPGLDFGEEE